LSLVEIVWGGTRGSNHRKKKVASVGTEDGRKTTSIQREDPIRGGEFEMNHKSKKGEG